ncbi:hypothetical protein AHF37_03151 [Paragonimus kellicotti]|nr:hypothetical protein AHF37_03151 [Paragonimus kellicotti]
MLAAEEKRRERFESMEGERENMRQTIREKHIQLTGFQFSVLNAFYNLHRKHNILLTIFSLDATKDVSTRPIVDEDLEAQMLAAEEKRRERFESMEGERENMRQTIREKVSFHRFSVVVK